jgi:Cu-Zn family superoxide dismutase
MKDVRKLVVALLVVVAAGALAACGSGSGETGETAVVVSGDFTPVSDAPAGYSEVSGEADVQRPENGGTVVSLRVTGLEPQTDYIAHLHTGGCDQADPGGPHFQFKKGGPEEPPNEIHLQFTSDAAGEGKARVSIDREVPVGEAGSVVVHTADDEPHHEMVALVHEGEDHGGGHAHSEKIACAELEGAAAGEGEATSGGGDEVPTIEVRNGEPVGGVQTLEFSAGEEIRFRVSSDEAEEIHVHGYDIAKDVPAGGTIEFDFPAELEGIYEAELEGLGVQIAELRVNP